MATMSKFKVGDRVRDPLWGDPDKFFKITNIEGNTAWLETANGGAQYPYTIKNDWILDAPPGPIRTVTCREIVPGEYGIVEVGGVAVSGKKIAINIEYGFTDAEELREASHLLAQLAEVLEENAAANGEGV